MPRKESCMTELKLLHMNDVGFDDPDYDEELDEEDDDEQEPKPPASSGYSPYDDPDYD
jgi:hypothetical protein